tara:strand:+ start:143 stop:682 length:540 start_codon:yes stop_codon:yes gene_type:complete
MDIGEADVATAEAVREFPVVHSHQVEQGGVEIVDLEAPNGGLVTPLVGFSMGESRFHTPPCHPEAEPEFIMIATGASLREGSTPEFPGPEHECFIEHPAIPEVLEEGSDRLIDSAGVISMVLDEVSVSIPSLETVYHWNGEFNEAHPAFHQSSGDDALPGIGPGMLVVGLEAVHFPDGL